jgi:tRNA (mo5U34)-methyltransferase
MTDSELRAEIARLAPWHHDLEVAPGLRTGEVSSTLTFPADVGKPTIIRPQRAMEMMVRDLYPRGLEGRSLLDCACNAGGYLFAAKSLGASRGFGFDVREHWIEQARFLAQHLPSDGLEFATCDLLALRELQLAQFDVVLFNGIFYHLPDPVAGLRIAADHGSELLVLNTAIASKESDSLLLNLEGQTQVMSGVHRLAWLPGSERVLREILAWCGFPHARVRWRVRPKADGSQERILIYAARNAETFAHYDAQPQAPRPLWKRLFRR